MRVKAIVFSFLFFPMLAQCQDSVPDLQKLIGLSLEELMNVQVVSATGVTQKVIEAPSTMKVITAKQIKERGYQQLEDALRDIPGVDFIHINGYVPSLIYFRGMYGAENLRVLLMIDGITENNIIGSNDMAGPAYSLHNVERIEVIWGPASALYGANAFGGVINIITKTGATKTGVEYEKGYGSFNTRTDNIYLGMKKNNLDIALSGSLYSTDGPRFTNRDPNYSASYVDKAYSLTGTVNYITATTKSTLGVRIYNTPMGWGTFLNSPTVFLGLPSQGYGNTGVIGLIARDVRGEKSGLEEPFSRTYYLQQEWRPSKSLNLTAKYVFRETGIGDNSYAYLTLDGRKLYRVPTTNYSTRNDAEISGVYSLGKNFQFSAGLQYYRDNIERGNRKINVDTNTVFLLDGRDTLLNLYASFKQRVSDIRKSFGSYIQFVWNTSFLKKTSFTIGSRYDNNNYYGNPVSPRLAIVSQPAEKITLKLMFGTAYRAPTNTEIYQAPPNIKLKVEKARTYEANFIYQQSASLLWQVNLFRNELRDVIILGNLVNTEPDKNPGEINVNGIEAKMDVVLSNTFSGFANCTWQDAVGKNLITHLVRNVPGIAAFKCNIGINIQDEKTGSISLTGNWVGKRSVPRTDPYGPVAGYFLTNLVLTSQHFFDRRVHASIVVKNLFNVKYLDPGFRTADGNIYSTVLEQPGINMLFKVGVTL